MSEVERALGGIRSELSSRPALELPPGRLRPASVLICLIVRDDELGLLFSERAADLPVHGGQISFPGGAVEPGETGVDAARRETEEEVGIPRERITILGRCDDIESRSGFVISPFVGTAPAAAEYVLQPSEVVGTFEVPLASLVRPDLPRIRYVVNRGITYPVYSYQWGDRDIWGLTAQILKMFLDRVRRAGVSFQP